MEYQWAIIRETSAFYFTMRKMLTVNQTGRFTRSRFGGLLKPGIGWDRLGPGPGFQHLALLDPGSQVLMLREYTSIRKPVYALG